MLISQKIPSKLEAVSPFILLILEKVRTLPFDKEAIFNIKLSLEEALVNAIKHGNKLNPKLLVKVDIETDAKKLIIKVKDEGKGFNFQDIPDPTVDKNILRTSGRGVYLIKKLMDKVDFFDGGSGLKMIKFFRKPL
jgi:serine/threonine-protein kinase RsbW